MEDHKVDRVEPEYTMQVVVARTGVPADTIRSWERRHSFPRPGRDGFNQRVYSESDIDAILGLNELRALGWSIPKAINKLGSLNNPPWVDVPAVSPSRPGRAREPSPSRSRILGSLGELADLLDAFEGEGARRILDEALTGNTAEDVCFSLLLPLSTRPTESGTIPPFRTGFVRQMLFSLYNASAPDWGRATILLAGAPGTRSESHLLCHAICASRAGYRTVLLGTDVALNHVEQALETIQPRAVMLTADSANSAWTLARWCHRMVRERPIEGWNGARLFSGPIFLTNPAFAVDIDAMQIPDLPDEARVALERSLADANHSLRIVRKP